MYCRNQQDPTTAALLQPATNRNVELNLFPLRSAQCTIDLGGSTERQIFSLISNCLHFLEHAGGKAHRT